MKPFNLEEAKAGKPVRDRAGNDVKIICFDREHSEYPIVALHRDFDGQEEVRVHRNDGSWASKESEHDLFMKGEKREGWLNVYKYSDSPSRTISKMFETKEEGIQLSYLESYIATVKIEWEE